MLDPHYPVQSHHLLRERQAALDSGQTALAKDCQARWLAAECLVDHRNRLIYCPIAKNASSSLKRMYLMRSGRGEEQHDSRMNMHKFIDTDRSRFSLSDLSLFSDERYFSFIVIRNPFHRLVSAYADKFVYKSREESTDHHAAPVIAAVQKVRGDAVSLSAGITFREFVTHVHASDDHELDPHWLPQSLHYADGFCRWSMVVQFENLGALFDRLHKIYPGGRPGPNKGYRTPYAIESPVTGFVDNFSKSAFLAMEQVPPTKQYFPPDLEAMVRERYAQDVEIYRREFGATPRP